MKTMIVVVMMSALMFSCSKSNVAKTKHQKTPSQMVMTHDEKIDVNYDARENSKVIQKNLANKDKNMKAARKQRAKQQEEMNKMNNSSSKVKRKKNAEAFNFY